MATKLKPGDLTFADIEQHMDHSADTDFHGAPATPATHDEGCVCRCRWCVAYTAGLDWRNLPSSQLMKNGFRPGRT